MRNLTPVGMPAPAPRIAGFFSKGVLFAGVLFAGVLLSAGCDDWELGHSGGEGVTGEGFDAVQSVFDDACISCHTGTSFGGLDLTADLSCASLIDVESQAYPGVMRVAPGDSASSSLWTKMADTAEHGGAMPPSGVLDDETVAVVAAWIDDGADCESTGGTTSGSTTGGSSTGGSSTGGSSTGGTTGGTTASVAWTDIVAIVDSNCVECHNAIDFRGEMNLDDDPCGDWVNAATSDTYPGEVRVVPWDKDSSVVWKKLNGEAGYGDGMPYQRTALSDPDLSTVGDWIDQGAPCK